MFLAQTFTLANADQGYNLLTELIAALNTGESADWLRHGRACAIRIQNLGAATQRVYVVNRNGAAVPNTDRGYEIFALVDAATAQFELTFSGGNPIGLSDLNLAPSVGGITVRVWIMAI